MKRHDALKNLLLSLLVLIFVSGCSYTRTRPITSTIPPTTDTQPTLAQKDPDLVPPSLEESPDLTATEKFNPNDPDLDQGHSNEFVDLGN